MKKILLLIIFMFFGYIAIKSLSFFEDRLIERQISNGIKTSQWLNVRDIFDVEDGMVCYLSPYGYRLETNVENISTDEKHKINDYLKANGIHNSPYNWGLIIYDRRNKEINYHRISQLSYIPIKDTSSFKNSICVSMENGYFHVGIIDGFSDNIKRKAISLGIKK